MMKKLLFLIAMMSCLISSGQELLPREGKPLNVIILIVDDMGYGDIAAHGNPIIRTPNFDALHDQCARFTNFAVSPSCAPTRAALLTGKHEFLSSVTHTIKPMRNMNIESTTIAELFQKEGYKTGIFGKWHLGQSDKYGPWFRGFDETLTVPGDNQRSHLDPVLLKNRIETKFTGYRTDILFNEAMDFIERHKDTPFFCYLPTYSPHSPHLVPPEYSEPYEASRDPEKPNERFSPSFNGQIANVDENLGRLRAYLNSLGLDSNTLLIVLNDNGGTLGVDTFNGGRRGTKGTIWSGGTRAYSFWKLGDRFPVGVRPQMSGHVDILPTLAELCNLEIPVGLQEELEGNSLLPVLNDPEARLDENRMQVHHVGRWDIPGNWADHKYTNSAVRWGPHTLVRIEPCEDENCVTCYRARNRPLGKYKLMYSNHMEYFRLTTPGQWELYNIETDPFQSKNIVAEHPDIVRKMSAHYEAWWRKVEVELEAHWGKCN